MSKKKEKARKPTLRSNRTVPIVEMNLPSDTDLVAQSSRVLKLGVSIMLKELRKLKRMANADKDEPLPAVMQNIVNKHVETLGRLKRTDLAARAIAKDEAGKMSPQEALAYVAEKLGLPAPAPREPERLPSRWLPIPNAYGRDDEEAEPTVTAVAADPTKED